LQQPTKSKLYYERKAEKKKKNKNVTNNSWTVKGWTNSHLVDLWLWHVVHVFCSWLWNFYSTCS